MLFLAVLGFCCQGARPWLWPAGVLRSGGSQVLGAQASVVAAWGSTVVALWLQSTDSVVAAHRFSCFLACGIFPDRGSKLRLLHWQADSSPLVHQGSPDLAFLII